jgi:hypothetical protein
LELFFYETLPDFYKKKAPKQGREKETKGQGTKSTKNQTLH